MATINTRTQSLRRLATGSFDVLIIGSGVTEAAIFASLASQEVSVAYISPKDFATNLNQKIPNLLAGGLADIGSTSLFKANKVNTSRNKLVETRKKDNQKIPYFSLIQEPESLKIYSRSAKVFSHWIFNNLERPRLHRSDSLQEQEPALRTKYFKGAIESQEKYFNEGLGRFAINLINHATTVVRNNAVAANYVKVISANPERGKPWLIDLQDTTTGEEFTLLSKVILDVQTTKNEKTFFRSNKHTPEMQVQNTHITIPDFLKEKKFLRLLNTPERQLTLSPLATSLVATSSVLYSKTPPTIEQEKEEIREELNKKFFHDTPLADSDIISSWQSKCFYPNNLSSKKEKDLRSTPLTYSIDIDAENKIVQLSNCQPINSHAVTEQISKIVSRLGVPLKPPAYNWLQGPPDEEMEYFLKLAGKTSLDSLKSADGQAFAERIWHRHQSNSFKVIDLIERRPSLACPLFEGADIIWAEIPIIKNIEMITSIEDFVKRRTQLAQIFGESLYESISRKKLEKALLIQAEPVKQDQRTDEITA